MVKKAKIVEEVESVEADSLESRIYELGAHLDPELSESDMKKAYSKIRKSIEDKGEILAEGEPTKIPLAYTISVKNTIGRRDFNSAFFFWIAYVAQVSDHGALIESFTEDKNIIRYIDLKTTKELAEYSSQMQELFIEEAKQSVGQEEIPEVEVDAEVVVLDPVVA
jgi:ribosomal protein S6